MSDMDYRDIWCIKNKHDQDKRAQSLFGITHPIPKITNALSIEYTNTLLPFSFFKPQKQLIVHSEKLTLTYSWNHNLF